MLHVRASCPHLKILQGSTLHFPPAHLLASSTQSPPSILVVFRGESIWDSSFTLRMRLFAPSPPSFLQTNHLIIFSYTLVFGHPLKPLPPICKAKAQEKGAVYKILPKRHDISTTVMGCLDFEVPCAKEWDDPY